MEKIFDNKFHRKYVGGEGEIAERETSFVIEGVRSQTYEDVLAYYRLYVGDKHAELPNEILEQLRWSGKI